MSFTYEPSSEPLRISVKQLFFEDSAAQYPARKERDAFSKCEENAATCILAKVQGYLAHKKQPPPRTLQEAYA